MSDTRKKTGLVIVASTRAARGIYEDQSGPIAVEWLQGAGFETPDALVVEDSQIEATFARVIEDPENRPTFILTSGGTGLNSDDRTVEAVAPYLDRQIPGIMHALWERGLRSTSTAVLSRGVAGVVGRTFVVTLPGSRGGVKDGIAVLDGIYPHILSQLEDCHDHS
ncbi:MogA/MoaB family molybdenum cofactor biosynthesis protein [Kocuria massiliensis]|uniref:MogA/MoaB family molybdenum cofactor biosynthesis protein n=1 Tax=Kocuria massiliensis TaxID=1926282 RepID=UPI000A1CBA55|nr:MogA/MoaB family molybdenum cofactor biosynthesis protein [Kocuria massiliensis]